MRTRTPLQTSALYSAWDAGPICSYVPGDGSSVIHDMSATLFNRKPSCWNAEVEPQLSGSMCVQASTAPLVPTYRCFRPRFNTSVWKHTRAANSASLQASYIRMSLVILHSSQPPGWCSRKASKVESLLSQLKRATATCPDRGDRLKWQQHMANSVQACAPLTRT